MVCIRKMKLKIVGGALCGALSLAGCEQYNWVPPATGSPYTTLQLHAICDHAARHENNGDSYVEAYGSPKFVGATVGAYALLNAIGTVVATQEDFNDCMAAHGWIPVAAGSPPPVASAAPPVVSVAPPAASDGKMGLTQAMAACRLAIDLYIRQSQIGPTAVPDDFQTCMRKTGWGL